MQADMSYLRPLIPSINSFGLCELEEEKFTKIKELNEEETIWLAIESIKEGAKKLYFTTGSITRQTPFKYAIKDRVVQQLEREECAIEQQEMRSETSCMYGPEYEAWLEGVYLFIKMTNQIRFASR